MICNSPTSSGPGCCRTQERECSALCNGAWQECAVQGHGQSKAMIQAAKGEPGHGAALPEWGCSAALTRVIHAFSFSSVHATLGRR